MLIDEAFAIAREEGIDNINARTAAQGGIKYELYADHERKY